MEIGKSNLEDWVALYVSDDLALDEKSQIDRLLPHDPELRNRLNDYQSIFTELQNHAVEDQDHIPSPNLWEKIEPRLGSAVRTASSSKEKVRYRFSTSLLSLVALSLCFFVISKEFFQQQVNQENKSTASIPFDLPETTPQGGFVGTSSSGSDSNPGFQPINSQSQVMALVYSLGMAVCEECKPGVNEMGQRVYRSYVRVCDVKRNSIADSAGILPGDILVTFDGETLDSLGKFIDTVNNPSLDDITNLSLIRNQRPMHVMIERNSKSSKVPPLDGPN